jgi:hypothetical protein
MVALPGGTWTARRMAVAGVAALKSFKMPQLAAKSDMHATHLEKSVAGINGRSASPPSAAPASRTAGAAGPVS